MPTIEIIALGCDAIPELPEFSTFGLLAETQLQSHRGIFQDVFDASHGVIVHLVNKGYETKEHQGGLFADGLIWWDQEGTITIPEIDVALGDEQWQGQDQENDLRFLPSVVEELKHLMTHLTRRLIVG